MLYKNGDDENALYLYKKYLESVPDIWKLKDAILPLTEKEKKDLRIFLKNTPDFWNTVQRIRLIEAKTPHQSSPRDPFVAHS
jgi:hypothetical protein